MNPKWSNKRGVNQTNNVNEVLCGGLSMRVSLTFDSLDFPKLPIKPSDVWCNVDDPFARVLTMLGCYADRNASLRAYGQLQFADNNHIFVDLILNNALGFTHGKHSPPFTPPYTPPKCPSANAINLNVKLLWLHLMFSIKSLNSISLFISIWRLGSNVHTHTHAVMTNGEWDPNLGYFG